MRLAAFYVGDFNHLYRTIGESLFFYNPASKKFEMGADAEMAYDPDFIRDEATAWILLEMDEAAMYEKAPDFSPFDFEQIRETRVLDNALVYEKIKEFYHE